MQRFVLIVTVVVVVAVVSLSFLSRGPGCGTARFLDKSTSNTRRGVGRDGREAVRQGRIHRAEINTIHC